MNENAPNLLQTSSSNQASNKPPFHKSHVSFSSPPRRGALSPHKGRVAMNGPSAEDIFISDDVIITKGQHADKRGIVKSITQKTCRVALGGTGNITESIPLEFVRLFVNDGLFASSGTPNKKQKTKTKTNSQNLVETNDETPRKRRRDCNDGSKPISANVVIRAVPQSMFSSATVEVDTIAKEIEKLNCKLDEIKINTPAKVLQPATEKSPNAKKKSSSSSFSPSSSAAYVASQSSAATAQTDANATAEILKEIESMNDAKTKPPSVVWLTSENKINPKIQQRLDAWRAKYYKPAQPLENKEEEEKENHSSSSVSATAKALHIDKSGGKGAFPNPEDILPPGLVLNKPKDLSSMEEKLIDYSRLSTWYVFSFHAMFLSCFTSNLTQTPNVALFRRR